ncbi:uncharacterized protein LOC105920960 [Fundulus heteroclitus]|uniref:uncharacterized protein LOC105920960 n=1 Tax=Fundulus heteroclitus TaxID=8078 RepID=UPI00165A364B|nr:uncharacterized protein LOC105920960 [Fundulus heteroclitus]
MAGRRQRWKPLQLLVIFSLLIFTNHIQVRGDVQEKLSRDVGAEHLLQGASESSRLIPDQLLLHNDKDLDVFLVDFNKETMEDWWQSVSEISASVRQKVLVLTGSTDPSEGKMRQENSLDPQKRAADFSLHGNTTLNSGGHLPKAALVHGPEEPNQENPPVYKVTNESDPVCSSRTAERADEPIVEFDQQQILMLEDDEVVRRAAVSLYDKHPAVSSVQLVGPQQRLQQVKGQALVLSEHSSLVLVGHGARDHSGEMRVSGYSYQDVARIIQSISRTSEKIQTTTVLACDAGSDRRFREALLKKLHEAGIETELHLWTAVVQVTETGEVISQDVSAGGAQWRSEDQTKKVVLTVGRKGEIRRKESDRTGRQVLTNHTRFLGDEDDPNVDPHLYRKHWPKNATTFIDPEVYKEFDQNKVKQVNKTFRILESLTWGLFYPEPAEPLRRINDPNPTNYLIGKRYGPRNLEWITDNNQKQQILQRCYVIENGRYVRNIIRHYGKDGEDNDSFLLINKWIFLVKPDDLYVYPVGKMLKDGEDREGEKFLTASFVRKRFSGTIYSAGPEVLK